MVTATKFRTMGNQWQLWRIQSGRYEKICTLPTKRWADASGTDLILPVGVRP